MDLRTIAVEETAFLHLRDAQDNLLYADGNENKPVGITLYGPGSKAYARANQAKQNRLMDRMKQKGKMDQTSEEAAEDNATFLASITKEFHYIERDELKDEALFKAVYKDRTHGFVADQAAAFSTQWGNFSKGSPTK